MILLLVSLSREAILARRVIVILSPPTVSPREAIPARAASLSPGRVCVVKKAILARCAFSARSFGRSASTALTCGENSYMSRNGADAAADAAAGAAEDDAEAAALSGHTCATFARHCATKKRARYSLASRKSRGARR